MLTGKGDMAEVFSIQVSYMQVLIMFARMFIHAIHNFNRGLTGAPMDEPKLVLV